MSEAISKRIKQLENQNEKLRKLLKCTLQITSEESAKCLHLQSEASNLKTILDDLENQKRQLENDLTFNLERDYWIPDETLKKVNIQTKLDKALSDLQTSSSEIQNLDVENEYIKELISELEREKEMLLHDIKLVQKADEENKILAEENLKLCAELARLQDLSVNKIPSSCSIEDLMQKLEDIEDSKQKLQTDIASANNTSDPLGIAVENTVLEIKISGLDKQRKDILKQLRASLLQSANEVSMLHSKTSEGQLRGLMNELNIHKTILMMNLNEVKEMHLETTNDIKDEQKLDGGQSEDFSTPPRISDVSELETSELPSVAEEDELLVEHQHLVQELERLERERNYLLEEIDKVNQLRGTENDRDRLHETFMKEESTEEVYRLPLDDATNQMYVNEEQMLAQRIRELEEDNERIRRNLSMMMEEKGNLETLETGEKVTKNDL